MFVYFSLLKIRIKRR